jgi:hypothetical protein
MRQPIASIARFAVCIGKGATDQRQGGKRQQIGVHTPLDGSKVSGEGGA